MAANVDNPNGFSFERRVGGGPGVPLEHGLAKSNVDIAAGDALEITLGLLIVAAAANTEIHGIAAESLTGHATKQTSIAYFPALPDLVFSGQTDGDASISFLGTRLGLAGTTGVMELDSTGATTSIAQIVGLKDGSAWDSNARLLFTIARSSFTGSGYVFV